MNYRITLLIALLAYYPTTSASTDGFDRWWSHATLYNQPNSQSLDKLALSGRLQAETAFFDADQGDYDDSRWRRFRFGFKASLFQHWVFHMEGDFDLNNEPGDNYSRLTDSYIGWYPNKRLAVKVLKQSAGFTLDGATSSKKLLTLQRNNLTNNLWFTAEYFTGATISGTALDDWKYKAGVFSSADSDEISDFDASYFSLLSLGRDFSSQLGLKQATVRLDYIYNDEDAEANTRDFSHVVSLSSQWQQGNWGLRTDLSAGDGYDGQSDIWGLVIMPFYDFTQHLQAVLRYSYISSKDDNGIRLGRYENEVVSGRGDDYREFYTGFNVFLYGHKLKWQTGLQYTIMDDSADDGGEYDGWGVGTGLRVSW